MRPMLDDLELPNVQEISTYDRRILAEHKPPGMEGSLFQNMGRRPERIGLWGLALGPEALQFMQKLNDMFQAGKPVSFSADIVAKSNIDQVLIEDLQWEELAGKPEQTVYILTLREYLSAVEPATVEPLQPEVPVPPVTEIIENRGTLIVEVVVEGRQDFDYGLVTVSVQGAQDDGISLSRTLTNRSENIWTEEDFPAGNYAVKAETGDPEPMTGTAEAKVSAGQTAQVTITLHPAPSNIAKTYVVHFKMDNAFIEPAMCQVLQRVADYAKDHPNEKLIILGHTDLVGSEEYNQNLSERRARSAYAFLTFGRDDASRKEAIDEWDTLRKPDRGWKREINDDWGTREYQFMLQNLSDCYYYGNIDGEHGPKTSAAVSAFQKDNGIIPIGVMTDDTWWALIEKCLDQASLAVPDSQFFRNARGACDGGTLKWLGAGEQDPVKNTQDAWRPNRRTELLFVQGDRIPCEVPKPRTFDKLMPGTSWCLGSDLNSKPETDIKRQDFLSRDGEEPGKWQVQPAEPGRIRIYGTITWETDDGPGVPNAKYVLTAPDGEYLHTDGKGDADLGERPQGEQRGEAIPDYADENGAFSYPEETPAGTYTLEILDLKEPALSRWKMDDNWKAKGNISFKQITESLVQSGSQSSIAEVSADAAREEQSKKETNFGAVQQPKATPPPPANPQIIFSGHPIVVVRRGSYVNPDRREIRLKTDNDEGEWLLTKDADQVHLFRNKDDTNEIVYNGQSNKFTGSELYPSGKNIYAEASDYTEIDGCELKLAPATGSSPLASKKITAVKLTLDLPNMDQPPKDPPASGQARDKWYKGGILFAQDISYSQERVQLTAKVEPKDLLADPNKYPGLDYILRQVLIANNNIIEMQNNDAKAKLFEKGGHLENEAEKMNPFYFSDIDSNGQRQFFVEGWKRSNSRGFGYQLGIKLEGNRYECDGDRAAFTVANFPRLLIGLNEGKIDNPLNTSQFNNNERTAPEIYMIVNHIYSRLNTSLEAAWKSQGAQPLPSVLPSGQEIVYAEEAWARQVTEMLALTAYGGPGQTYFNSWKRDSESMKHILKDEKYDDPGNPAYPLVYACQQLSSFGVGTRVRKSHQFKRDKNNNSILLGAGSATAGAVRAIGGAWYCISDREPADPTKLNCPDKYRKSDGLFDINLQNTAFEFTPGSVFVFSNRSVKAHGSIVGNTITEIVGNEERTYAQKNGIKYGSQLQKNLFNTGTNLLLDNSGGAHIGFVLRAEPMSKLFQVFDTGALNNLIRGSGITLFRGNPIFISANFDDPSGIIVSGSDPFRGVGVWTPMNVDDAKNMNKYVEDVLKRARPLGFARLIIIRNNEEDKKNQNRESLSSLKERVEYASPLLKMYDLDPTKNYAISRYIWSLRGISNINSIIQWWIYVPAKELSTALINNSDRTKNINELAHDAYNLMNDNDQKNYRLENKKINTALILKACTLPIVEFQVPWIDTGKDAVEVTYLSKPTPWGKMSLLHEAEGIIDKKILLPMNEQYMKPNDNRDDSRIPEYFRQPPPLPSGASP